MNKPVVREVFVLRLWKNASHAAWIIEIQNVNTGEITHLQDLNAIPGCIGAQLQVHSEAAANPPKDSEAA